MQVRCLGDKSQRGQTETCTENIFGLKDAEIDAGSCRKSREEIYGCGGRGREAVKLVVRGEDVEEEGVGGKGGAGGR